MKEALSFSDIDRYRVRESGLTYEVGEEEDSEDNIRRSMEARGRLPNLSFFAFTATPKAKTLELFGTPNEAGIPAPFHLYSMRQAIEEGFILDVLQHYTTYKTYFKLYKAIAEDPKLNKKKATRAMARFVSLHPHNIAQKKPCSPTTHSPNKRNTTASTTSNMASTTSFSTNSSNEWTPIKSFSPASWTTTPLAPSCETGYAKESIRA